MNSVKVVRTGCSIAGGRLRSRRYGLGVEGKDPGSAAQGALPVLNSIQDLDDLRVGVVLCSGGLAGGER